MENGAWKKRNYKNYNGGRKTAKTRKAVIADKIDKINKTDVKYPKIKKKSKKSVSGFRRFLFVFIALLTVTVVFLFFTNRYFFKVQKIEISDAGGNEKYSYDDILNASGIATGSELYGIDLKQIKDNIEKKLTYVNSVNITQIPPSTVSIKVRTDKGMFGFKLGGDYYIIADSFRVVDKIELVGPGNKNASDFVPPAGIVTVVTGGVKKCCVGEKIEFSDPDIADFMRGLVNLYKDYDLPGIMKSENIAINSVNIKDKFNVVMNYGDRFLIKFGVFNNISSKILNSFDIINQIPADVGGVIDMTDAKVAPFEYDENILKNKLYFGIG